MGVDAALFADPFTAPELQRPHDTAGTHTSDAANPAFAPSISTSKHWEGSTWERRVFGDGVSRRAAHGDHDRRSAARRATEILEAVGLSGCLDKCPRQLSGGQQQRVAIARALVAHPRLILADEPTASLDSVSGGEVAARIRELAKQEGCAAVIVTHDHRILRIADRVLDMEDGRLHMNGEATPVRL